ncbi:protein DEFECTIVE IN MERISTEM SILENCING 3 isoform X3 [Morus notabilis]|uniref:protein DEFECTIVE IN MERISTEM SILENCING 3 isoform X3 n=1 Tax=Morus notabilis TaxID=981085 RepID=UPI000CED6727|nr:protein DEFECTIVE IN MERISTEM SILENCING 3 isoform X3 [Morus notabilis]
MFFTAMSKLNLQQNAQGNLQSLENTIKQREDNLTFLTAQTNHLDESILDLQANGTGTESESGLSWTEEDTIEQILKQENSAASVLCRLNSQQSSIQGLDLAFTKDVLGIVATLARVGEDNLSRLLSEYLGMQTMLAIVCRTYEGVKALEKYDEEGNINSTSSLHGAGSSAGKRINGRFLVICLEDLRQYVGEFADNDPQRKLALPKPKLPNGECPKGFLDYAVNLISLDSRNLSCVTANGQGLRETLFYNLFSCLQIYRTRTEMLEALPCVTDGALSLDGGVIRKSGVFFLGSRKDTEVKFPVASGKSDVPEDYIKSEAMIRMMKWERANILGDMRREQELLNCAKANIGGQA